MDPATSPLPSPSALSPQGDFASVPAPDLLAELIRRRFTGTLRVDRNGMVKVIYFSQGDLACASSNAEEDRLGNLLVRTGRLTNEQLSHAKTRQTERSSIGNILVELGYITAAELLEGARRQVEEIVTDLMGWRQGTYQVRAVPLSREVVNLSLPARVLLVRALQNLNDRELVLERLGSLESVPARVEPFDEAARALDFGFSIEPLLEALDGKRSVREICESVDMEDFQVCKILYTLLILGLLRRATNGSGRELVFVEGELQNGETLPRADETGSRWGRRRAAAKGRASGQSAPAAAGIPVAAADADSVAAPAPSAEQGSPAGADVPADTPAEPAGEEIEVSLDDEPTAIPPATRVVAIPVRRLVVRGALALLILGLVGGIVYFTYFRPTLTPDDVEEERLLAALMDEARQELEPPRHSGSSGGKEATPSGAGAPGAVAEAPPTAAAHTAPSGSGGPAAAPTGAEPPPAAPPPAPRLQAPAPRPAAPASGLEKARLQPMLSADANFRSAMELMRRGRFPEAAESFQRALESQDPGTYAIQVLLACQDITLQRAFERAPDRTLYFVATTFRGQACYRLLDGLYSSESEARSELDRLPALFREDGNRPVVVRAPRP